MKQRRMSRCVRMPQEWSLTNAGSSPVYASTMLALPSPFRDQLLLQPRSQPLGSMPSLMCSTRSSAGEGWTVKTDQRDKQQACGRMSMEGTPCTGTFASCRAPVVAAGAGTIVGSTAVGATARETCSKRQRPPKFEGVTVCPNAKLPIWDWRQLRRHNLNNVNKYLSYIALASMFVRHLPRSSHGQCAHNSITCSDQQGTVQSI